MSPADLDRRNGEARPEGPVPGGGDPVPGAAVPEGDLLATVELAVPPRVSAKERKIWPGCSAGFWNEEGVRRPMATAFDSNRWTLPTQAAFQSAVSTARNAKAWPRDTRPARPLPAAPEEVVDQAEEVRGGSQPGSG